MSNACPVPDVAVKRLAWAWAGWAEAALFVAALLPGHAALAQTAPEPRLALVIGNANYKNSPLINP